MTSDDVKRIFPGAPDIAPGLHLFALLAADGSPIMLTDSRDTALANAWEHRPGDGQPALITGPESNQASEKPGRGGRAFLLCSPRGRPTRRRAEAAAEVQRHLIVGGVGGRMGGEGPAPARRRRRPDGPDLALAPRRYPARNPHRSGAFGALRALSQTGGGTRPHRAPAGTAASGSSRPAGRP